MKKSVMKFPLPLLALLVLFGVTTSCENFSRKKSLSLVTEETAAHTDNQPTYTPPPPVIITYAFVVIEYDKPKTELSYDAILGKYFPETKMEHRILVSGIAQFENFTADTEYMLMDEVQSSAKMRTEVEFCKSIVKRRVCKTFSSYAEASRNRETYLIDNSNTNNSTL